MGNRGNSIEDQLNLFKIVYKLKVSELRKKFKRLKNSESFWFSKHDEMKLKMKELFDQIEKPKNSINNVLIFKAEATLRNNLITNNINNEKTKNKCLNNPEAHCLNFNETCNKLTSEYDEKQLHSEISELKEELELLYFEQEEPNQQIQILRNYNHNLGKIEAQIIDNTQIDDVINTVQGLLKPKEELLRKLQYFKKMKFLNN